MPYIYIGSSFKGFRHNASKTARPGIPRAFLFAARKGTLCADRRQRGLARVRPKASLLEVAAGAGNPKFYGVLCPLSGETTHSPDALGERARRMQSIAAPHTRRMQSIAAPNVDRTSLIMTKAAGSRHIHKRGCTQRARTRISAPYAAGIGATHAAYHR